MSRSRRYPEPSSPGAWQLAVDSCHVLLLIDSARQYGLIKGGPVANVERCEDILKRGKTMGYVPSEPGISFAIKGLCGTGT